MELIAKVNFSGKEVSARAGQEFTCSAEMADDLIKCGYAEKKETPKKGAEKVENKRNNVKKRS